MRGFWDYEIAGTGLASSIMQLEAMYAISPENEQLGLALAASDIGYANGWLEVEMERAEDAGEYEESARLRRRSELLYQRARDLACAVMRRRDAGIDAMLTASPSELKAYLEQRYADPEDDIAPVFWAGIAWGAMLGVTEDISAAIALPAVRTLVEHSVSLDPGYELAAGLQFLGGFYSQYPAAYGGDPKKGKVYFERALKLTGRRAHVVHVTYAKLYALTVLDKPLFMSLLREVMQAPDQGRDYRLANKIARRKAELLLAKADELLP